jgi:hypothetical protein
VPEDPEIGTEQRPACALKEAGAGPASRLVQFILQRPAANSELARSRRPPPAPPRVNLRFNGSARVVRKEALECGPDQRFPDAEPELDAHGRLREPGCGAAHGDAGRGKNKNITVPWWLEREIASCRHRVTLCPRRWPSSLMAVSPGIVAHG